MPTPSTPLPRAEPTEAMQPCAVRLCELRPEFGNLSLEDQAAMILNCRALDAEAFRVCAVKHDALAKWISEAK